jgi:putative nucleotidyltransferase with HDIG domain
VSGAVSTVEVALSEVLGALSYALDITEGEPPGHAVRSAVIGMRLAEAIGLGEADRTALFYALLIKDAGCSSNAARLSELFDADDQAAKRAMKVVDWSKPGALAAYTWRSVAPGRSPLAKARAMRRIVAEEEVTNELMGRRCEMGARIAHMLELPGATGGAIRALDEHWDGSGQPLGLRGEEIPLLGRILCLAQTVEVFLRGAGLEAAMTIVRRRRGRWFDPALADALLRLAGEAAFWGPLERSTTVPALAGWEPADRVQVADDRRLDRVATAFAHVIDAKSPYTARHSQGVAHYAVAVATALGMAEVELRDLRRAGLLHDIGKLAVSSRVLDKPGRLDPDELAQIRTHPLYTERILERVACFRDFADVAAAHHERLDGGGYHRGRRAEELTRPMRVLAVADVYEALTADRPYRAGMSVEQALAIVVEQRERALDPASVDALAAIAEAAGPPVLEPLGEVAR